MPLIHRLLRAAPLALACAAARADAADAQLSALAAFSVEARGGIAIPADDFDGADGGVAGEMSLGWQALPLVGFYAAYGWTRFDWSDAGGNATDQGFTAGVRVSLPAPFIPIDPWIRAGIVAHWLEAETLSEAAKRGWEAGAGLLLPYRPPRHPDARGDLDAVPARQWRGGRGTAARAAPARGRGVAAAPVIHRRFTIR